MRSCVDYLSTPRTLLFLSHTVFIGVVAWLLGWRRLLEVLLIATPEVLPCPSSRHYAQLTVCLGPVVGLASALFQYMIASTHCVRHLLRVSTSLIGGRALIFDVRLSSEAGGIWRAKDGATILMCSILSRLKPLFGVGSRRHADLPNITTELLRYSAVVSP
uniref:Uncharacterized protein TCIL3000_11_4530 n=1 Tax=Trypanosoma congolense (strain IL3000) TaxID=1068625 RepID=G0V078_TRYCI|nr:unnamed protein product [Trypanosoma congolense IL3000]